MDIPFMRLDRQFARHRDEFMAAVEEVFSHGRVLQGPEVSKLEEEFAAFAGKDHAVATGSATDALYFALIAAGAEPGDRIAVPTYTFVASASVIARAGAIPVFVDIDNGYQPDTARILELIEDGQINGVIAAHMFGQMADIRAIYAAAQVNNVYVIEDAAQALGSERHEVRPGAYSDAACFSFDPTKIIGAQGSGGMLVTDSEDIAIRVMRLRYHGKNAAGAFEEIGFNSQMASAQAALITAKFRHLEEWIGLRMEIADQYNRALADIDGLDIPEVLPGARHVFHKYVLRAPGRRDALAQHLKDKGVSTMIHYDTPLHHQPAFQDLVDADLALPAADHAGDEVISIPIYPELTAEETGHICDSIREFFS